MTHFNLLISLMRVGPLGDAEHEEKGVWLDLVTFCCEQENGGKIHNADKWTAKQWARIGLTFERLKAGSPLWKLTQNGTLIVSNYPHQHESRARAQRDAARRTNEYRWKRRPFRKSLSDTVSESLSDTVSDTVSDGEEKVREGKRMELLRTNGQHANA